MMAAPLNGDGPMQKALEAAGFEDCLQGLHKNKKREIIK